MAVWETEPALMANFANVWQAADKVVYSTTLDAASTANTRLERGFDPSAVREMKTSATSDLTVGGAHLAGQAFETGLIDEYHLFVHPVLVGGGKSAVVAGTRANLVFLEHHQFENGVIYLRYRISS